MTSWRHRQRNRYTGSIMAIIVAYVLFLHVLLGGYAQAALLGGGDPASSLLCDAHGRVTSQVADTSGTNDFHHLLCQSACAFGTGLASLPAGALTLANVETVPAYRGPLLQACGLFVLCYARAPPLR